MSSGPEGEPMPSRRGRIADGSCSHACAIQAPLDVVGGSIYDNARQRRLSKDYERKVQTSETLLQLAMIRLMVRRLARSIG